MKAYLKDYTLTQFDTNLVEIIDGDCIFTETYFYSGGGYQAYDTGKIVYDGNEFIVTEVYEKEGTVRHKINNSNELDPGSKITCFIDKSRRKYLSALHSAQHILSRILFDNFKINTISANMDIQGGSVVFSGSLKEEWVQLIRDEFNKIVKYEYKVTNQIEDDIVTVSIGDFDSTLCGGTHVSNTSELDSIYIYGVGKKTNVLCFDSFSNYGITKMYLDNSYSLFAFLNYDRDYVNQIQNVIMSYNQLLDDIYQHNINILYQKLNDSQNIYLIGNRIRVKYINIDGTYNILKIYKKILKKENFDYESDICIFAIGDQIIIESKNFKYSAMEILEKIKKRGLVFNKGGGSKKRISFLSQNSEERTFEHIYQVIQEIEDEQNYNKEQ